MPASGGAGAAKILSARAVEPAEALKEIESLKGADGNLKRIHELVNEADGLSRAAIAGLFQGGQEALEVIKWRDVYHALEETIDAAEDAGEVMERMLHKGA